MITGHRDFGYCGPGSPSGSQCFSCQCACAFSSFKVFELESRAAAANVPILSRWLHTDRDSDCQCGKCKLEHHCSVGNNLRLQVGGISLQTQKSCHKPGSSSSRRHLATSGKSVPGSAISVTSGSAQSRRVACFNCCFTFKNHMHELLIKKIMRG